MSQALSTGKQMVKDGRSVGFAADGGLGVGAAWGRSAEPGNGGSDPKRPENEVIAIVDDDEWGTFGSKRLNRIVGVPGRHVCFG